MQLSLTIWLTIYIHIILDFQVMVGHLGIQKKKNAEKTQIWSFHLDEDNAAGEMDDMYRKR